MLKEVEKDHGKAPERKKQQPSVHFTGYLLLMCQHSAACKGISFSYAAFMIDHGSQRRAWGFDNSTGSLP